MTAKELLISLSNRERKCKLMQVSIDAYESLEELVNDELSTRADYGALAYRVSTVLDVIDEGQFPEDTDFLKTLVECARKISNE